MHDQVKEHPYLKNNEELLKITGERLTEGVLEKKNNNTKSVLNNISSGISDQISKFATEKAGMMDSVDNIIQSFEKSNNIATITLNKHVPNKKGAGPRM